MATARAAANALHTPLYRYLGGTDLELPQTFHNVINGGEHADTGGQRHHGSHRSVPAFGDNVGRPEFPGQLLPVLVTHHRDDALGPAQLGRDHTAQANRTVAQDHDCIPGLDLGRGGRMIAGRHYVCQRDKRAEHRVAVVARLARDFHQAQSALVKRRYSPW